MMTTQNATHRLAFHGAALATLGTCPTWDKALTEYLARAALADADEAFGQTYERRYAIEMAEVSLAINHGPNWERLPDLATRRRELADADNEVGDVRTAAFMNPLEHAAHGLAQTPAPTIAAALFKVELIERHQLWDDARFDFDGMQIVRGDIARITGIDTPADDRAKPA